MGTADDRPAAVDRADALPAPPDPVPAFDGWKGCLVGLGIIAGVLALLGASLWFVGWWFFGGGVTVRITNTDDVAVEGVTLRRRSETIRTLLEQWEIGTVRPGQTVELEIDAASDTAATLLMNSPAGVPVEYRIHHYLFPGPIQIRIDVKRGGVTRVRHWRGRGESSSDATTLDSVPIEPPSAER